MSEMPLYNPKNDSYLHKRVPIDSFGANGKLEPIRAKRRNTDSKLMHEVKTSRSRIGGVIPVVNGAKRRKSHVDRPKSQVSERNKRHSQPTLKADVINHRNGETYRRPSTSHTPGMVGPRIGNLVDFEEYDQMGFMSPGESLGSLQGLQSSRSSMLSTMSNRSVSPEMLFTPVEPSLTIDEPVPLLRPSSSSSRITEMIEESSKQMFFSDLRSSLRKLWTELHIPDADRLSFIVDRFREATSENIEILQEEVKRLTSQREIILRVLRCIEKREEAVKRLSTMCAGFQHRGTSNRILFGTQIQEVLQLIRYTTLETVEVIVDWKRSMNTDQPFMWKSQNYLERIKIDTKWFEESAVAQMMRDMDMDTGVGAVDDSMLSKRRRPISANLTPLKRQPTQLNRINLSPPERSDDELLTPLSGRSQSRITPFSSGESSFSTHTSEQLIHRPNEELSEDVLHELESVGFIPHARLQIHKSQTSSNGSTKRRLHSTIFRSRLSILENQNNAAQTIQLAWKQHKARTAILVRIQEAGRVRAVITLQLLYRRWKGAQLFSLQKRAYCATIIQSCWRQFKSRNVLHLLQSKQREHEEREILDKEDPFLAESHTTSVQQPTEEPKVHIESSPSVVNALHDSVPLAEALTHTPWNPQPAEETNCESVVRLQSSIRSSLIDITEVQKQIRHLQSVYRTSAASRDTTVAVTNDRDLCIFVQNVIRQRQALLRFQEACAAKEAADRIHNQQGKEEHAARIFQLFIRMFLAREQTRFLIVAANRETRVTLVQSCLHRFGALGNVEKRREEIQQQEKRKNAQNLQNLAKAVLARAQIESLRQEKQREYFVVLIQSLIRAIHDRDSTDCLRKEMRHQLDERAKDVLSQFLVQHIARSLMHVNDTDKQADPQISDQIRREKAALTIQCIVRKWLARRRCIPAREAKQAINRSASLVQALWKGYKVRLTVLPQKRTEFRQQLKQYLEREKAVGIVRGCLEVQEARRAVVARADRIKYKDKYAVLTLQCLARRMIAIKRVALHRKARDEHFNMLLQREAACFVIQRGWKAYQSMLEAKSCARDAVFERQAVPVLQRAFRCFLARRTVQQLRESRQRSNEEFLKHEHASIIIQCAYRHYFARKFVSDSIILKKHIRAATILQRAMRIWLFRHAHTKRANQERAASTIQRYARAALVRLHLYDAAAVKIQRLVRRHTVKKFQRKFQLEKIRKNIAARSIQHAWEHHTEQHAKTIENEVVVLQSIVRSMIAQRALRRLEIRATNDFTDSIMGRDVRNAAAACIQRSFKAYRAHKHLNALRLNKKELAALRIQLAIKRRLAVRRQRKLMAARDLKRLQKHREEGLVLWIQCVSRTAIQMRRVGNGVRQHQN